MWKQLHNLLTEEEGIRLEVDPHDLNNVVLVYADAVRQDFGWDEARKEWVVDGEKTHPNNRKGYRDDGDPLHGELFYCLYSCDDDTYFVDLSEIVYDYDSGIWHDEWMDFHPERTKMWTHRQDAEQDANAWEDPSIVAVLRLSDGRFVTLTGTLLWDPNNRKG